MDGGGRGTLNGIELRREGVEPRRIRKASAFRLQRNDVISIQTGGGGGWGDPFERDPESVSADVRAGLITQAAAAGVYGVALTDDRFAVDLPATAALRLAGRPSAGPGESLDGAI